MPPRSKTKSDDGATAAADRQDARRTAATDTANVSAYDDDGRLRTTQDGDDFVDVPTTRVTASRTVSDDSEVASDAGVYRDPEGALRKVAKGDQVPDGWTREGDVDYAARAEGTDTVQENPTPATTAQGGPQD
jgi:hypothetical protein